MTSDKEQPAFNKRTSYNHLEDDRNQSQVYTSSFITGLLKGWKKE